MMNFRQYRPCNGGPKQPHSTNLPRVQIGLWWLLLIGPILLAACGCGNSAKSSQDSGPLAGNWQFTLTAPSDGSFTGAPANSQAACGTSTTCSLQLGGFLLQANQSLTGSLTYSIVTSTQALGTFPCSGSAPITGTVNGQNVTFTVQAGPQSFHLSGTVSADGKTMMGTYSSTNTSGCGNAQSGLQWSAVSVPPLAGAVQGFFHSRASHVNFNPSFPTDQDFPVSGVLTQGPNVGSTNATVTGTLSFQGGYPCLGSVASVNGQISGSSIVLEIIAGNGLNVGQIGSSTTAPQFQASPVALESTANGMIVIGQNGYAVSSKKCPGSNSSGDSGNICIALGDSTACQQPVLMTPAALTFPPQLLGSTTSQTITLRNNDPSPLTGLTLVFIDQSGQPGSFGTPSDFNGLSNFAERDNCAPSLSTPFALAPGQSCAVRISFSPQQSCPWLPYAPSGDPSSSAAGAPPTACPLASTGKLILTTSSANSSDSDGNFAVPVTGTGLSAIVPFPAELDFGAEVPPEKSQSQTITFTNQGVAPVQILPPANTACGTPGQIITLPRPLTAGAISGLQVVQNGSGFIAITPNQSPATVTYACDLDPASAQPNFQISNDSCSGTTLNPQQTCSIRVSFVPQPQTSLTIGLDFFLELNTLECTSGMSRGCEIDSGRFPVELKANLPSPLRMSPGAGLNFGMQSVGQTSAPLTVTLFNDPKDLNAGTVNFTGNRLQGDYFETDNCGGSLAPGSSCTLTITFTPQIVGYDPGNIAIGYTLRNIAQLPQAIYLRGTGQ